jgi:hypothetical protein
MVNPLARIFSKPQQTIVKVVAPEQEEIPDKRTIHLRIKVKSLAAEAQIIRQEAKKTRGMIRWDLNHHRKTIVRSHTRTNLLAYGILKGIPYSTMEKKCFERPDFSAVANIAKRFGATEIEIVPWIEEAKNHLKRNETCLVKQLTN